MDVGAAVPAGRLTMHYAWEVATPLVVAAVLALATAIVRARRRELERDAKLDRIIEVFEGRRADRIAGTAAEPGLVEQIDSIREQLLHRNNGSTVLDQITRIELAVQDQRTAGLATARRSAFIETLLRKHMRDSKQAVGIDAENDRLLWAALREHGVELVDPLPQVDLDSGALSDAEYDDGDG